MTHSRVYRLGLNWCSHGMIDRGLETSLTVGHAVEQGRGIVDCGLTRVVSSVHEQIQITIGRCQASSHVQGNRSAPDSGHVHQGQKTCGHRCVCLRSGVPYCAGNTSPNHGYPPPTLTIRHPRGPGGSKEPWRITIQMKSEPWSVRVIRFQDNGPGVVDRSRAGSSSKTGRGSGVNEWGQIRTLAEEYPRNHI